jgi:MFS family permease
MSSLVLLLHAEGEWRIWLFIPLFTVVESTFPVNWSTVGEYFGRRHFAKIRGTMSFIQTWGSVIGPVIAGTIYDATASYTGLLWSSTGVLFVVSCFYAMVTTPISKSAKR